MSEAKRPFVLTPDKLVEGAAWTVVLTLGAGAVVLGLNRMAEPYNKAFAINTGCTGLDTFPVTSREPLQDVYNRLADHIQRETLVRPNNDQMVYSVAALNFGPYRLPQQEITDIEAGKVPNGYSLLLVPEKCPDPNQ